MCASNALQGQFLIQVHQIAKQLAQADKHFQTEDVSVQLDSIRLEQHADFVKSEQFTTLLGYRVTKPVPIQTATSKTVDAFATLHTLLLMKQSVSYAKQTQPTICHRFHASHQHLQTM
jgi:histone acetyltransferase (RNA polymerase elongator complex component)